MTVNKTGKWITLENAEATATLKQHCFVPAERSVPYTREKYQGNKTLCSRGGCSADGDRMDSFESLKGEELNPEKACKKCLRIYNNNIGNENV